MTGDRMLQVRSAAEWEAAARALQRAALAVGQPGGAAPLRDLVREVAASIPVAVAYVAVFADDACSRLRTLACVLDGRQLDNFEYALHGSLCEEVVGKQFRWVGEGVGKLIPAGSPFSASGLDAYAAYPLTGSDGTPLGLLVTMDRKPVADVWLAEAMLKIFAARMAAEIERGRADQALREAALAVSHARSKSVFAELVRYLATILHVEIAFIARHEPCEPDMLSMLALICDGQIIDDMRYSIGGTPCATVLGQRFRFYRSRLHQLFPDDPDITELGADSYAGYPLTDLDGAPVGIICIASRQPLAHPERIESMLQIFAVRAAAEIERLRADEAVHRSEASYRAIFEAAEDAIFVLDWDSAAVVDVNPKACEVYGYGYDELRRIKAADVSTGVPPYTAQDAMRWIGRAKAGESPVFEWQRLRNGTLHWDEVRLKAADIGGKRRVLAFSREITERKLAEEALRLREAQYRAVFDGSADALILRNRDTRVVDVNRAFTQMYGFSREEILGTAYDEMPAVLPDLDRRIALLQRALAGEEAQLETTAVRKNGERFDVELRCLPIQHRGEPHALVVARDITARKAADEGLRLREEQYRVIFEASLDAFILRDAQLRVVDVNPAFLRLTGFTREDLLSRTGYPSNFPDEHVAERHALIRRGLAGETIDLEMRLMCAGGRWIDAEVRVMPLRYRGEPHVLSMVRDITDRKQAESQLKLREEQYRAIFDGSADALVLWSRDIRVVDINRAFTRMYGYERDEIVGATFSHRLPRDEVERRTALIRSALEGHEGRLETRTVRKNGETFEVELRYLPIVHRGEPHVLAVARDITERRQDEVRRAELESQLRQAQKMEAIGQLTGGIAHDFNNILTSVIGYTTLASDRAESLGDKKLLNHLEQVRLAGQRARELIAQMLAFARRQRIERRVQPLAPVLRQSVQLLRSTLPTTLAFDVDLNDSAPPVAADAVQIEQVLFNLCINARDAISGAGRIAVRLRECDAEAICASCRAPVSGHWVELAVADDGCGIGPELRERMFDPFFTTKDAGRGSGMGLAMVHGIVHDHGGHLLLESEPGHGARFRVLLPAAGSAGQRVVEAPAVASATAAFEFSSQPLLHGRVMVVEDQTMVGAYTAELLGGWGLDVTLCDDPIEAERRFAADPAGIDVVITDQTMPRLTGLELAQRLTSLRPSLPVLLYTGYADGIDDDELRRSGVRTMLGKPVERDALLAALRAVLAG